jgi:hypothetical protein
MNVASRFEGWAARSGELPLLAAAVRAAEVNERSEGGGLADPSSVAVGEGGLEAASVWECTSVVMKFRFKWTAS